MTPTDDHLLAFGRVIHNFATVESGIKIALSGILEVRLAQAMVAFEPYTAADVKKVARSLAKSRLKPALAEQFCWVVGEWAKHSGLRNTIAHSRWTEGKRPNSIKPRTLRLTDRKTSWIGVDADEADITAEELEAAAHSLHEINERLKDFLEASGLQLIVEKGLSDREPDLSVETVTEPPAR